MMLKCRILSLQGVWRRNRCWKGKLFNTGAGICISLHCDCAFVIFLLASWSLWSFLVWSWSRIRWGCRGVVVWEPRDRPRGSSYRSQQQGVVSCCSLCNINWREILSKYMRSYYPLNSFICSLPNPLKNKRKGIFT